MIHPNDRETDFPLVRLPMPSRYSLLRRFGTGFLGGVALGDWLRLLREIRFRVAPSCLFRAGAITTYCGQTSFFRRVENLRFGSKLESVVVQPPIFVLGHWRSGTTHLHQLLTVDNRFAYPNNYQVLFPHAFLTTEAINSRMISLFMPKRRPMDNVEWDMRSPQEDEFALCISTFKSPYMRWIMPQFGEKYDRYLTFRGVPEAEIAEWRDALMLLLKKLTLKYQRPLVLKSPPHTARIRLLLEMFPDAKFIHIHREPYTVFQSSRKTFLVNLDFHRLQRMRSDDIDDWIIAQYRRIYDAYFEERSLIPVGQFHEIGFEELEANPLDELRKTYDALNLPDYSRVEPALKQYLESISNYKKNEFPSLRPDLRSRIATEWRKCFDEWGYAK